MKRTLPHCYFYSWQVPSDISLKKQELRKRFRFERSQRSLGGDWLHLLNATELNAAKTIASYLSYGDEPETTALNDEIRLLGKKLVIPKTDSVGVITWIEWNQETRFERDNKRPHFTQPIGSRFDGDVDLVITPALRVDRQGVRLGQGGGSYDRALQHQQCVGAWKVALLHDEEISSEALPCEDHDVKMDAVALPEILVRFKRV